MAMLIRRVRSADHVSSDDGRRVFAICISVKSGADVKVLNSEKF